MFIPRAETKSSAVCVGSDCFPICRYVLSSEEETLDGLVAVCFPAALEGRQGRAGGWKPVWTL